MALPWAMIAQKGGQVSSAMTLGLAEFIIGQHQMNKANKMPYLEVDPLQEASLQELQRKQRNLESGYYFSPEVDAIKQSGTTAMSNVAKMTGGDVGATIAAIQQIYGTQGKALSNVAQQQAQESLRMDSLISEIVGEMANRRQQVSGWKKTQEITMGATNIQSGLGNMMAAFAAKESPDVKGKSASPNLSSPPTNSSTPSASNQIMDNSGGIEKGTGDTSQIGNYLST